MKRYPIGALIVCGILVLALAGCAAPKKVDAESLKGFWVLEGSDQLGFKAVLNLEQEDNYAEFMLADAYLDGTWATDGQKATITFDDGAMEDELSDLELEEVALDDGEASGASASAESASAESASAESASAESASAESASAESASAESAASGESSGQGEAAQAPLVANIYVSDNKLIMGNPDGSKLIFTKGNMDSYFAENPAGGELDNAEEFEEVEPVIEDISPVKVVDDDNCTINVTGKGTDGYGDPGYRMTVKNNTKKTIYITADDTFKVGDKSIEGGLGEIIEPGETMETFLYFAADELGGGPEALKSVTGKLTIGDDDTGDEIQTYPFKMD